MIVFSSRVSVEAPAINFETWGTKGLPRKYSFFSSFSLPLTRPLTRPSFSPPPLSFGTHSLLLLPLASFYHLDLPPRGERWLNEWDEDAISCISVKKKKKRKRRRRKREEGSKRRNLLSLRLRFSFPAVARASIKPRSFLPSLSFLSKCLRFLVFLAFAFSLLPFSPPSLSSIAFPSLSLDSPPRSQHPPLSRYVCA